MLKFFRKYNKLILAVTAAFLMVAFLAPQALQQIGGDPRDRAVARLDGRAITEWQLSGAAAELQAVSQVDGVLQQTFGLSFLQQLFGIDNANTRDHWLLLTTAAEEGGFYGGPQDGRNFLLTVAEWAVGQINQARFSQTGQRPPPEQTSEEVNALVNAMDVRRAQAVGNQGMTGEDVNIALAKAHGVLRMLNTYTRASQVSDLEAVAEGRRIYDEVVVDYALIPATSVIGQAPQPTDEDLRPLFEKHKDVLPGEGEHGFGYRQRRAVKIEFLALSRSGLEGQIDPDPVDIYTRWERNKGEYGANFDAAKERVEEDLRKRLVDRALAAASQTIKAEILRSHQGTPREDGRLVLPENWDDQQADFEAIADKVSEQLQRDFGVESTPIRTARQENIWWDRAALESLHPMSNAGLRIANSFITFPDIVFAVLEEDPTGPFQIQERVAFTEPLRSRRSGQTTSAAPEGDLFFFRVLDARESAPPETLEEVRSDVAQDWRALWAFERLAERASEIKAQAIEDFGGAAEEYRALRSQQEISVRRTGMLSADRQPVDARVNTQVARDAILDRSAALDPTVPIETIPLAARTFVIPLPDSLHIALVRVKALKPIALEIYRREDSLIATAAARNRDLAAAGGPPFSFEKLAERMNYVQLAEPEDDELPEDAPNGEQTVDETNQEPA